MTPWRWRWYRWTVVIAGLESGDVSVPIDFIRFRHRAQADAWCERMNDPRRSLGLTQWRPIPIPPRAPRPPRRARRRTWVWLLKLPATMILEFPVTVNIGSLPARTEVRVEAIAAVDCAAP